MTAPYYHPQHACRDMRAIADKLPKSSLTGRFLRQLSRADVFGRINMTDTDVEDARRNLDEARAFWRENADAIFEELAAELQDEIGAPNGPCG